MESDKPKEMSAAKLYIILMFLVNVALGVIALMLYRYSAEREENLSSERKYYEQFTRVVTDKSNKPYFGSFEAGDPQKQQALREFINKMAQRTGIAENIRSLSTATDRKTEENLVNVRIEKARWEAIVRFMHAVEQGGRSAYTRELRTDKLVRNDQEGTTTLNATLVFAEGGGH